LIQVGERMISKMLCNFVIDGAIQTLKRISCNIVLNDEKIDGLIDLTLK
jgi:hypothetical protein